MTSPLGCPYSEDELDRWDGVNNPMGNFCYECEEWECEHNANGDNPNFLCANDIPESVKEVSNG